MRRVCDDLKLKSRQVGVGRLNYVVEKSVKSRVFAKVKPWYNELSLLYFTRLWAINLQGRVKILKECIAVHINDRAQQSRRR